MSLFVSHHGESGPRVVLIHGWGLHGGVWDDALNELARCHQVTVVDLPGHGRSGLCRGGFDLANVASMLATVIAEPAYWIGWSLGGLVASRVAHDYPAQCLGLGLVASNPRFVRGEDWPHAQPAEVLVQFADALERDYRATVQRFVAVQALTSPHAKEEMRRLRHAIFAHGEPDPVALRGGLAILAASDLRELVGGLSCPVQMIMGTHDTLAPVPAGEQLKQRYPQLALEIIQGAGHCPFMTHTTRFVQLIERFTQTDAR